MNINKWWNNSTNITKYTKALDPNFWRIAGYCASSDSLCENKKKELCDTCKWIHNKLLDMDFKVLSLNNFLTFSVSDAWKYFERQKLWRKSWMNNYIPDKTNIFAKKRNLNSLKVEQLKLWEIYFVFNKFLNIKKEEYKNQNNIIFTNENKENTLLDYDPHPIKDYFDYNILGKNFSFNIQNKRPKNTSLVESVDIQIPDSWLKIQIKQNSYNKQDDSSFKEIIEIPELTVKEQRFKKLSDQVEYYLKNFKELIDKQGKDTFLDTQNNRETIDKYHTHVEHIENTHGIPDLSWLKLKIKQNTDDKEGDSPFKAVNRIPKLTIKEKRFKKLSDQVKYYLENFWELEDIQKKYIIIDTSDNRKIIDEYITHVEYIEHIVSSNSHQWNSYINTIFWDLKREFEKDLINIEGKEFLEKMSFEVAPTKRDFRAVQKIIISHNWNLSKATDQCRGTKTFDNIDELQKGCVQFVRSLEKYNKKQIQDKKWNHTRISEIYFEDKFWNFFDFSKKSSGYRDGKFLIKLWDGNVFELMVQLKDMGIAKNEWFEYIAGENMKTLISKMEFTQKEKERINSIIDTLDEGGTKWGKVFLEWLKYFDKIQEKDKLPADFIYNIYRNLDEYDRDAWKKKDTFPFDKNIKDWTLVQKLQFMEREVYQWGFKLHSDRLFSLWQQERHKKNDNKLKEKLNNTK